MEKIKGGFFYSGGYFFNSWMKVNNCFFLRYLDFFMVGFVFRFVEKLLICKCKFTNGEFKMCIVISIILDYLWSKVVINK